MLPDMFTALGRGVVAGTVGTGAMDALLFLRYRQHGGTSDVLAWELSRGLNNWESAPVPAKVGKLLYETLLRRELPPSKAALTSNLMHWSYGLQWGALFGLSIGRGKARWWQGLLLGALVWLASYVSMPIAGFYKPIWSYDLTILWDDLSAHLLYGFGVAAACRLTGAPPVAQARRH